MWKERDCLSNERGDWRVAGRKSVAAGKWKRRSKRESEKDEGRCRELWKKGGQNCLKVHSIEHRIAVA